MAGLVYALLVGINDYRGYLQRLDGCINDVNGFEGILRGRVPEGRLRVRRLLDQDAKRQQLIDAFSAHFADAGSDDVAVFYFAGHGSVEEVEERFWFLEPSGKNQTLVCADSRRAGVPDLADKELSVLLDDLAARGPHVLVVLDCCHSGGLTRHPGDLPKDVRVRRAPPAKEVRRFESYLPELRAVAERAGGGLDVPRHVALSACESSQFAVELPLGGSYHGVFSVALQQALATLGSEATYRDVIGAAANRVRNHVAAQDPVAYATDRDDLDQPMLGGVLQVRRSNVTLSHYRGAWWIDVGAVHGILPPAGEEATVLAVLPPRRPAGDQPLGRVRVSQVDPTRSRVECDLGWSPDIEHSYPAVVVDVPLPPATVELRGEAHGRALIRAALRGSLHVREVAAGEHGPGEHFLVLAEAGRLVVARADATPLASAVDASEDGAARVARRLDHVARWHLIKALDQPVSAIAGKVTIEVVPAEEGEQPPPRSAGRIPLRPDAGGDIRLRYRRLGDAWLKPHVFVYLHNRSDRDLYCALLDLTDRFRCHGGLLPVVRVKSGLSTMAFEGRPIPISIPQARLDAGGAQVRDWLKLIASEQRFESDAYELPNLDGVVTLPARAGRAGRLSVLDRIGNRALTRDAGSEAPEGAPEWTTAMVSIVTERPAESRGSALARW